MKTTLCGLNYLLYHWTIKYSIVFGKEFNEARCSRRQKQEDKIRKTTSIINTFFHKDEIEVAIWPDHQHLIVSKFQKLQLILSRAWLKKLGFNLIFITFSSFVAFSSLLLEWNHFSCFGFFNNSCFYSNQFRPETYQ